MSNFIGKRSKSIRQAVDFKEWDPKDMSEAFWISLGKYVKEPNANDFTVIEAAYNWAVHANHALFNSFVHALKWVEINLYQEGKKWQ